MNKKQIVIVVIYLLTAIILLSCESEDKAKECDCKEVKQTRQVTQSLSGTSDTGWNQTGTASDFSKDCNDNGIILTESSSVSYQGQTQITRYIRYTVNCK